MENKIFDYVFSFKISLKFHRDEEDEIIKLRDEFYDKLLKSLSYPGKTFSVSTEIKSYDGRNKDYKLLNINVKSTRINCDIDVIHKIINDVFINQNHNISISADMNMNAETHETKSCDGSACVHGEIKDLDVIQNLCDGLCIKSYYELDENDLTPDKIDKLIEHGDVVRYNDKPCRVGFFTLSSENIKLYLKEILSEESANTLIQSRIYREVGTLSVDELKEQLKDYDINE